MLQNGPHCLDGRTIDPKPCNPRTLQKPRKGGGYKIFLGGLPSNITETDLRHFFNRYGKVTEVVIMYDQEKKKSRGFGFLSFEDEGSVDCKLNIQNKRVTICVSEKLKSSSSEIVFIFSDFYLLWHFVLISLSVDLIYRSSAQLFWNYVLKEIDIYRPNCCLFFFLPIQALPTNATSIWMVSKSKSRKLNPEMVAVTIKWVTQANGAIIKVNQWEWFKGRMDKWVVHPWICMRPIWCLVRYLL